MDRQESECIQCLQRTEPLKQFVAQVAARPDACPTVAHRIPPSAECLGDGFIDNRFPTGCGIRGLDSSGRDHAGRFRGRRDVPGLLDGRSLLLQRGVRRWVMRQRPR